MRNFWILLAKVLVGLAVVFGIAVLCYLQLSQLSTTIESLKSLTDMAAIIIAGLWTYNRFIKTREDYPYPKIQHRIEDYYPDDGFVYISVFVTVTNEGKTKLDLGNGKIFLRQVSHLSDENSKLLDAAIKEFREDEVKKGEIKNLFMDDGQRIGWETIGRREWRQLRGGMKELEPGQTREIQFDFIVLEDDIQIVEAISYFTYAKSSWELSTIHPLKKQQH